MRHHDAGRYQVAKGRGYPGRGRVGRGHHHQPGDDQGDDGDDFDQAEPELHLTESLHGQHVEYQEQEHGAERWNPCG
ncbi:hypothetical protein D9M72_639200 [compost metagenome]